MKSGDLNFLEPSGPLHVCNGTDLTFYMFRTAVHVPIIRRNIVSMRHVVYVTLCRWASGMQVPSKPAYQS